MIKRSPFRYCKTSPEIIRLAAMLYVWFPLSLRNVEDLLHERGIEVSHETIRFWCNRFGPQFASEIRKRRAHQLRSYSAALREKGNSDSQTTGQYLDNMIENSHLPFRRRERAMSRFRRMRSLQKFVSIHASVFNHFNHVRSLTNRDQFELV